MLLNRILPRTKMKTFKSTLAAITITATIIFSCRLVMIPTPLSLPEQIGMICMMIELSFFKAKELEVEETKKKDGQNDK
jgi:hypothetical protein